jgi:hypothetical protein
MSDPTDMEVEALVELIAPVPGKGTEPWPIPSRRVARALARLILLGGYRKLGAGRRSDVMPPAKAIDGLELPLGPLGPTAWPLIQERLSAAGYVVVSRITFEHITSSWARLLTERGSE